MRLLTSVATMVLVAGCAAGDERPSQTRDASLSEACVVAGDQCVKNIGDVAGCRASQAMCLAMGAQMASSTELAPPSIPETGAPIESADLYVEDRMPPAAPMDEQADDRADPATVARCADAARHMIGTLLHGHIDRVLVTHSPRWGVIWRADFTAQIEGRRSATQRYVCAKAGVLIQPLEMFDPSQNLAPLPGQNP